MEATTLQQRESLVPGTRFGSVRPLWLQSDERLVYFVRAGNLSAFDVLFRRYQARLLGFCRRALKSESDAEDVLQDVFTAAFYAIQADERKLEVRPWLYQIARNRCLDYLRRASCAKSSGSAEGAGSDDALAAQGADRGPSAADRAAGREEFRLLVDDLHGLAEMQRTALVLRELHGLPYEQVAAAMGTSVPSVKSLLVRARASLVEAAQAREVSCDEARLELDEAEGPWCPSAAVRAHAKHCVSCRPFRKPSRRRLAAVTPLWPLATLKTALFAETIPAAGMLGTATASGLGGSAAVGVPASTGALAAATKAAAGIAGVLALAGGVSSVDHAGRDAGGARSGGAVERPSVVAPPRAPSKKPLAPHQPARTKQAPVLPAPSVAPAVIESSPPDVAPGGVPRKPSQPPPASERPPGTVERGRPTPGAEGRRRTRPPPDSLGQTPADPPPAAPPTESTPSAPPATPQAAAPPGE